MSPNSRPPLTTRIRNSFESKRTKSEIASPTHSNGFGTPDPQAIRAAIDEAINGEAFQTAIAANLARLIRPSIKDALDTLQPVVEAVYSHEMLLRKTNRSVENILTKMDTNQTVHTHPPSPQSPGTPTTPRPRSASGGPDFDQFQRSLEKNNKRTVATLAELSSAVETNNKKMTEVVDRIEDVQAILVPTKDGLSSMKDFSDTSNTNTAVMQAQLDQLKADLGLVIDAVGSDLHQNVKSIHEQVGAHPALLDSHATKLDAISTDLVALKGQADVAEKIQTISADLDALKSHIEGNTAKQEELLSGLGSQIGSVLTAVEGHTGTLSEIKEINASPAILEAVEKGNESHASHAAALGEIKERSLAPGVVFEQTSATSSGDSGSTAALEALKADFAVLKENIEAGLSSNTENFTGLGSKVDEVLVAVEGHKAADQSADILAAVQKSNDSHASHSEALEGVRSLGATPAAPAYDTNFAALEAQIVALQTTLHSHTGVLDGIKTIKPSSSTELVTTTEGSGSSGLDAEIGAIIITLESHTNLLNEIKDDVSAEILTALHDVGQTQASHSTILAEIREADVSDEILTALHASNDSHANHASAFEQLHGAVQTSNDSHTAHAASLDELKTSRSVEPGASAEAGNLGALEAQIGTLVSTLEEHKATLAEIKDATDASNESHNAHTASLDELKTARSVEPSTSAEAGDLGALEAQIGALVGTLEEHKATLAEIKDATMASNELHTAHTASLDEIKSRAVEPAPSVAVNLDALESQIGALSTTLEEHKATLAEIKDATNASNESHVAHTASLDEIKSRAIEPVPAAAVNLDALESQIGALSTTLDEHKATLSAIHEATNASNASHAVHATTLDEIKSRSVDLAPAAESGDAGPQIGSIIATLEEQNATLAAIKDTTAASHELHGSHATALDEIKDATSGLGDFHTSHAVWVGEIKDAHASHTTVLDEIKGATATSNESHASHTAILNELKDAHTSHAIALDEIKGATTTSNESHAAHTASLAELKSIQPADTSRSAPDSPDLPAMEEHFTKIFSSLETQNGTLAEIKEVVANPDVLSAVKQNHELLSAYTPLLESIKEGTSHEYILSHISELKSSIDESKAGVDAHGALVKDLHTETKDSHSHLTEAIGALALGGAAGAGASAVVSHGEDNSEILEEVKAVRAIVEKSSTTMESTEEKLTSVVSQIDINHTTVTTSITTLSDELKAEVDATGTQITDSLHVLASDVKAIDIAPLNASVDIFTQEVKNVATSLSTLEGHVQDSNGHLTTLSEGVHLNEKGLGQLKEHSSSSSERGEPIPESSWFKKTGSPTVSRQIVEEPAEPAYNYLSPVAEEQTPTQEKALDFDTPEEVAAPAAEPEVEAVPEPEPEPVVEEPIVEEPEIEAVPEPEPEAVAEEAPDVEAVPELEPIVEKPETEAIPEPETESEHVVQEPEIEAVPESEPVIDVGPEIETAPEPIAKKPSVEEEIAPEVEAEEIETSALEHKDVEPEEESAQVLEAKDAEPEVEAAPEPVTHEPEVVTEAVQEAEPEELEPPVLEHKEMEPEQEAIPEPSYEGTEPIKEEEAVAPKPIVDEPEEEPIQMTEAKDPEPEEDSTPVPESKESESEDLPLHEAKEIVGDEPAAPGIQEHLDANPEKEIEPLKHEYQEAAHIPEVEAIEPEDEPALALEPKELEPEEAPVPGSEAHILEPEPEKEIEPEEPEQIASEKAPAPLVEETPESSPNKDDEFQEPSTPIEPNSESASASTSAFASPMSPNFPLSPSSKKGKKGKKEKKEKKEKKGKGKKEKVPFTMDGEDPDED